MLGGEPRSTLLLLELVGAGWFCSLGPWGIKDCTGGCEGEEAEAVKEELEENRASLKPPNEEDHERVLVVRVIEQEVVVVGEG